MLRLIAFASLSLITLLATRAPVQALGQPPTGSVVGMPYRCQVFCLAGPDADDFAAAFDDYFTIVGGSAPFTLGTVGGMSLRDAARALRDDMLALGYPNQYSGNPYLIDARGATSPNDIPVIWKGCDSTTKGAAGGGGVSLVLQDTDVILLGTGYDGNNGNPDPGTNTHVRAVVGSTRVSCYAVAGDGEGGAGAAAGGWAEAWDSSGTGGGGATAWGGNGINGGVCGEGGARQTAANAWARGGDSDSGVGGAAEAGRAFSVSVGGTATAIGGDSTSGNGGAATSGFTVGGGSSITGNASATGGNSSSATGGLATVDDTAGNGTATGGTSSSGNGGSAIVGNNAPIGGNATATGGSSSSGNGGNAVVGGTAIGGNGLAFGGSSPTGNGGTANCGTGGGTRHGHKRRNRRQRH